MNFSTQKKYGTWKSLKTLFMVASRNYVEAGGRIVCKCHCDKGGCEPSSSCQVTPLIELLQLATVPNKEPPGSLNVIGYPVDNLSNMGSRSVVSRYTSSNGHINPHLVCSLAALATPLHYHISVITFRINFFTKRFLTTRNQWMDIEIYKLYLERLQIILEKYYTMHSMSLFTYRTRYRLHLWHMMHQT